MTTHETKIQTRLLKKENRQVYKAYKTFIEVLYNATEKNFKFQSLFIGTKQGTDHDLFTLIQNMQIQKYINLVDMAMCTDDKRKFCWQDTNRIERSCQSGLSISKIKIFTFISSYHYHLLPFTKFSDKWKNN